MAASLSTNAMQVNFELVPGLEHTGMAPNKKKDMKVKYRMLHDIVVKALCAEASSFDVVTSEKFDLMVAISAGLKMSVMLDKLVKADLGESVKAPLDGVEPQVGSHLYEEYLGVGPSGETSKISGEKTEVEKKKKKKEKVVVVKKPVVIVEKQAVAGSQAAPEKSTSGTSSDGESRPLSKLGAAKKHGATPKRQLVIDSSASESTAKSNPGPTPDIPTEADDISTTGTPEANVESRETVEEQADPASKGKEILEAYALPNPVEEHCLLVLNSAWDDVSSKMCEYDKWVHFCTEIVPYTAQREENNTADNEEYFTQDGPQRIIVSRPQDDVDTAKELTYLKALVSYLGTKINWIGDDTYLAKHTTLQFRRQLDTKIDGLDTSLIRHFADSQQNLEDDITLLKSQVAEMVDFRPRALIQQLITIMRKHHKNMG
ncbi:BTB/POZ and TAZ domain-containing protein 4-like [Dorcoceras hygrometricum]|uniref:BTB/POZ and TAZ domain-containing protein 4-like n=1 Tax=Dorcoceras hygrometricum TaxID=472368 RepID=A0A2Z7BDQ5_9LAMI|nr:BTB/POZ and TAZ domain-containing protein 4-like [Dorcoceras hygrometricum]